MPWGSSLFPLLIVTSSGRFTGLFVYSPAPGNGNLIASITASSGTDPFGNHFNPGVTVYNSASGSNPGVVAQLNNGAAMFSDPLSVDPEIFVGGVGRLHAAAGGAVPITFINSSADDAAGSHSAIWLTGQPLGGAVVQAINLFGATAAGAPLTNTIINAIGDLIFGTVSGGLPVTIGPLSILRPSGDTSGATDSAKISRQLGNGPGTTVMLMPGQWYVNSTVTVGLGQYLIGAGKSATSIRLASGTGPAVKVFSGTGSSRFQFAGVSDLTVDGTGTTNAIGLQAGDVSEIVLRDVAVTNFGGGTGVGFNFVNTVAVTGFTEQLHGQIYATQCDQCMVFSVSGGTNSFERMALDFWGEPNAGGFHLITRNNAFFNHGRLAIRGNSLGVGGAVISMQGTSAIGKAFQLDIGVENDATSGASPQTINFASASNTIDAYGEMEFLQIGGGTAWAASNNNGNINYAGKIYGDPSLIQKIRTTEWTVVTTGFPAGWTGSVKFRSDWESGDVTIYWTFTIAATTVVTDGQAITTVAVGSQFFNPTLARQTAAHIVSSGGLAAGVFGGIQVTTGGLLNYFGASFTVGGSAANFTGQATYNNTI